MGAHRKIIGRTTAKLSRKCDASIMQRVNDLVYPNEEAEDVVESPMAQGSEEHRVCVGKGASGWVFASKVQSQPEQHAPIHPPAGPSFFKTASTAKRLPTNVSAAI